MTETNFKLSLNKGSSNTGTSKFQGPK